MEIDNYKKKYSSKEFLAALEPFKDKKIEIPIVRAVWVSQLVSRREWGNHFSFLPSYYKIGEEMGRIKIGFVVADKIPFGCKALTEIERIKIEKLKDGEITI